MTHPALDSARQTYPVGRGMLRSTLRSSSGARDNADFFRLAAINRAPVKSHSFKLKIILGVLRYR
jgi:hypothetical protein